ncbi:peptide ABC transporter permease [Pseudovibrio japonicus]|uniref:Peptide ABC transporter permease n=1 Tax=Pseudovibrio japonicus TaxID=366534 RepID=A0ABQ3EKL1_9HYPH|nr:ABC transporter permease [Pseudovibrio japonicus]GHB44401.1 peptide ABC transporter permease [Pseudovibrio japonicus]
MKQFVFTRTFSGIPTLFGMTLIGFLIIGLTPGDPIEMELRRLGVAFSAEQVEALRVEYGLNKPLIQRYFLWLFDLFRLDLGTSIASGRPVLELFKEHLPITATLSVLAFMSSLALSLGLGGVTAVSQRTSLSTGLYVLTMFLVSVPSFWLALFLLAVFALGLGWFKLLQFGNPQDLILPTITLSLGHSAVMSRLVRERIIAVMSEDYIRLAIAKGLTRRAILGRHVFKSILPPLITNWAISFGSLLGGSVIVENIFNLPGLGQMALQAIAERDFAILQAYLLFMGLVFFLANFVADLMNHWLTPQIKKGDNGLR